MSSAGWKTSGSACASRLTNLSIPPDLHKASLISSISSPYVTITESSWSVRDSAASSDGAISCGTT